jgi:ribosomal silencing factor RsfS
MGRSFVVADLPGLIEGAHTGAGLGIRFLRHIERTRLVAHLIDTSDASDRDPVHDFEIISGELAAFSEKLAEKPVIVVATKLDATTDRTRLEKLRDFCAARDLEFHAISSASGEGIPQLVRAMADALDRLAPPERKTDASGKRETGNRAEQQNETPNRNRASRSRIRRSSGGPIERRRLRMAPRCFSGAGSASAASRFSAAHSIPFTSATLPWRAPPSAVSIWTKSISFPRGRPAAQASRGMASYADRYAMDAIACADHPSFIASLAESGAGHSGREIFYSVDTVKHFKQKFHGAGVHLYFLMGADSFLHIPAWKDYETLLGLCDFIVASRPGFNVDALRLVIPPELFARPGSAHAPLDPRAIALAPHDDLRAGHGVQPRFGHRGPPSLDRQRFDSRACAAARRGIHYQAGPLPVTGKKDSLPPHVRAAIEAAQEKQAAEVTLLDLEGLGAFTDYFLSLHRIQFSASGRHLRRNRAAARAGRHSLVAPRGQGRGDWMLLDFGGLIVHVFTERARHLLRSRAPLARRAPHRI